MNPETKVSDHEFMVPAPGNEIMNIITKYFKRTVFMIRFLISIALLVTCLACVGYGFIPFIKGSVMKFNAPALPPEGSIFLEPTQKELDEHWRADKKIFEGFLFFASGMISIVLFYHMSGMAGISSTIEKEIRDTGNSGDEPQTIDEK